MALQIDVISDLVCPWCFIAKRRLRGALGNLQGPSMVNWLPMQLYPEIPPEGIATEVFLAERFGDLAGVRAVMANLKTTGHELGIRFDFDRMTRIPNTLDAHRLVNSTGPEQQDRLVELLFSAFFEQGLDISQQDVLVALAESIDISPAHTVSVLADENSRTVVLADQARLRESGLSAVPGFLLNRRVAVSGAAESGVLVRAFDYALFGLPEPQEAQPVIH